MFVATLCVLAAIVTLSFAANFNQATDLTRTLNAYGPEVVEAVVNIIRESCLFADDRRFLRRLAYVESQDGTAPRTFRAGYNGGIWQVDNTELLMTQNNPALYTQYAILRKALNIDWSTVAWAELRKPLYSGIAAALYAILMNGHGQMSWNSEQQGSFWAAHFHSGSKASNFTEMAKILDLGCKTNQKVDLVFVVDTSSSLSSDDFIRAQIFMKEVVDGFDISQYATQVAVVTYSSSARVEFYLNTYRSLSSLQAAIDNIVYTPGGTNTAAAITVAINNIFTYSNGARTDSVRVMVVITDGNSDDTINTRHAAERAHANAIVTFSVGVGHSIGTNELHTIATSPTCTHAYQVNSYEEIKFMKEEIQKATCIAPLYITTTYSCEISHCPPLAHIVGPNGTTIETNITCGGMSVYSSITNPYPSSAQYDEKDDSFVNHPTQHFFNVPGKTLYIIMKNNQGIYSNLSANCIATITPYTGDRTDIGIHVRCFRGDLEIPCDDSYFNCTEKWNFNNPCTQENLLAGRTKFPHPYQNNKFLMCDLSGKLYVVICPRGEIFFGDCSQCIGENTTVSSNCNQPLPTNVANPCTRENILADKMFFEFPGDIHKFIHCDVWGHPWERDCPIGQEWDQGLQTCIVPSSYNPCYHHQAGQSYLFPHQCDPHQYIHCDTNHQSFIQSCQFDYVFYPTSQTCVPKGSYPGTAEMTNTCYNSGSTYQPLVMATSPGIYYGSTSLHGYVHSNNLYTEPCTLANIQANNLYFPVSGNNHQYIQCDDHGYQYLRTCLGGGRDYYDPYSHTCVDGPVFVDQLVG